MIYVQLINNDLQYEIRELIKVFFFHEEIIFIENLAEYPNRGILIINKLEAKDGNLASVTRIYRDSKQVCEKREENLQNINIREKEIKKKIRIGIRKNVYESLIEVSTKEAPWGILTGVRPVKIVHNLLDRQNNEREIKQILSNEYKISKEKTDLVWDICKKQRQYLYPLDEKRFSLYIGIPFCPSRCLYCSFPALNIKRYENLIDEYTEKLIYEIKNIKSLMGHRTISTVYIGGGTPTSIPRRNLEKIILNVYENFSRSKIKEITVEAGRPDTINSSMLNMLHRNKINRISINPQTMNDETLKLIGRKHKSKDIIKSFYLAKEIGFDIINMDLILGLPGEGLNEVEKTLVIVKELEPDNLTVHTLAVKRGSRFKETMDKYAISDQATIIEMLNRTQDCAKEIGLEPYYLYRQKQILGNLENIGYSLEGKECIYNIRMMEEKETVMAAGMGAVSKIYFPEEDRIERVPNVKSLEEYLSRIDEMIERKSKVLNGS